MKIILETPRLILRHQVPADLDDLWALYCDPEITKYIPDAPRHAGGQGGAGVAYERSSSKPGSRVVGDNS